MLHLWYFLLAIFLFLGVNWIGEHSSTFGYLRLSLHVREVPAPAFNFVLKALAPSVYIIIVAAICYVLKRDSLVRGVWLVAVYYFAFRLLFNIAFGRAALLDWFSVLRQATVGIGAAYLAYVHFILPRRPLLPGVQTVGDQLPLRHISIRVPWHDSGWAGVVCKSPRLNASCLKLKRIAISRQDEAEERVAGLAIDQIESEQWPCCVAERGMFMAPFEYTRLAQHPYSITSPETHGH